MLLGCLGMSLDWQTRVVVLVIKKGDLVDMMQLKGDRTPKSPWEGLCRGPAEVDLLVKSPVQEEQCGFRPCHRTLEQLCTP